MQIDFLGHAAFLLTTASGTRILIDPYESGGFDGRVGYGPIEVAPDLVVITHDHLDHSHTAGLPGDFEVIRKSGRYAEASSDDDVEVRVRSVTAFHDRFGGTRFGGEVDMKVLDVDGLTLCHAGDLGEDLTDTHLDSLGSVDVFIPPVGGYYTLDGDGAAAATRALQPRVVIPCHFKTPKCGFDIEGPEPFLERFERVIEPGGSVWDVTLETLPASLTCVYLRPRL